MRMIFIDIQLYNLRKGGRCEINVLMKVLVTICIPYV